MLKRTMATGLLLALLASGPAFADSVIYTKQTVVSNDLLPLEEQSLTLWTDVPLLAPSTAVSLYYDDGSLRYWPGDTYNPIYRIRNIWPLLVIMVRMTVLAFSTIRPCLGLTAVTVLSRPTSRTIVSTMISTSGRSLTRS